MKPTESNTDGILLSLSQQVPDAPAPPAELCQGTATVSKTRSIKLDPTHEKPASNASSPEEVVWPAGLSRAKEEVEHSVAIMASTSVIGQLGVYATKGFEQGEAVYTCRTAWIPAVGEIEADHFELVLPVLDNLGRGTLWRISAAASSAVWPNFNSSAC